MAKTKPRREPGPMLNDRPLEGIWLQREPNPWPALRDNPEPCEEAERVAALLRQLVAGEIDLAAFDAALAPAPGLALHRARVIWRQRRRTEGDDWRHAEDWANAEALLALRTARRDGQERRDEAVPNRFSRVQPPSTPPPFAVPPRAPFAGVMPCARCGVEQRFDKGDVAVCLDCLQLRLTAD